MQNESSGGGNASRWVLIIICLASLAAVAVQWGMISKLRGENESLRAKQSSPAPAQPAVAPSEASAEDASAEKRELLRLRNEVRQLRERMVAFTNPALPQTPAAAASRAPLAPGTTVAGTAPTAVTAMTPAEIQKRNEEMRQLGLAVSKGESGALEKLAGLAVEAAKRTNELQLAFGEIKVAFDVLGSEAGPGNEAALDALTKAARMDNLQAFAIRALGEAAGRGNEKALEPLLDAERNKLSRSASLSALKPAADAGNVRAIEALAATASEPNRRTLWSTVVRGLDKAAVSGNATAIDALIVIGRSGHPTSQRAALQVLEKAAANNHPKAAQAVTELKQKQ